QAAAAFRGQQPFVAADCKAVDVCLLDIELYGPNALNTVDAEHDSVRAAEFADGAQVSSRSAIPVDEADRHQACPVICQRLHIVHLNTPVGRPDHTRLDGEAT